ncbi:MAG: DNA gyrase C-terminal beta-propeller domain-containing protein, partial [Bacteroidales bacterium]
VKTISVTDKTGALIAIKDVTDNNDLMIINKSGIILRMAVKDLRIVGRATQGVKLIDLRGKDAIASVTKVDADPEEELLEEEMMDVTLDPTETIPLETKESADFSASDNNSSNIIKE